jgi:rSAM/selenodomain-associated transferase 1
VKIRDPKSLLIIFVRNPVRGKVKTRLAATIGDDKALAVYHLLLQRTIAVTRPLEMDKVVFTADSPELPQGWEQKGYQQQVQQGSDLGERMAQAITAAFAKGYNRVGIMGSDCFELTTEILREAFALLAEKEVVIGPATDGGYYFLGLTRFQADFFQNKAWSTASVLQQTLADAERLQLPVALLPELSDVDEEKDLVTIPGFIAG